MEPPSPPLRETQKATKEDNIWIQAPKKKKSKSKNLLPVLVYPCSHTSLGALPQTHLLYTPTPQIYVFSVYIWIQNSPSLPPSLYSIKLSNF